jgi:hypothetical protein
MANHDKESEIQCRVSCLQSKAATEYSADNSQYQISCPRNVCTMYHTGGEKPIEQSASINWDGQAKLSLNQALES